MVIAGRKTNRRGIKSGRFALLSVSMLAGACIPQARSAEVRSTPARPPVTRAAAQAFVAPQAPPEVLAAQRTLDRQLKAIGAAFNGDVGIAVKDVQTGYVTHFDGNTHYPQQSVSKFWVALAALDRADRGDLSLSSPVTVRNEDLTVFHQPIRNLIKGGGFSTTLSDLLHRALQQSDNTANDFVMRRAGGPEAIRDFLDRKNIDGVRFGPGEKLLQAGIAGLTWQPAYSFGRAFYTARANLPQSVRAAAYNRYVADPVDGAKPTAIVDALARLKRGELLSPESTQRLLGIMSNTKTGPQRLKGGLAPGYRLAHKTGTGQVLGDTQSGYNDIGIITSPDGDSYAVAVMIRRTAAPVPERMSMMQNVTRAVIDYDRDVSSVKWTRNGGASRTAVDSVRK